MLSYNTEACLFCDEFRGLKQIAKVTLNNI